MIILLLRTICTFIANDIRICLRLCKAFLNMALTEAGSGNLLCRLLYILIWKQKIKLIRKFDLKDFSDSTRNLGNPERFPQNETRYHAIL